MNCDISNPLAFGFLELKVPEFMNSFSGFNFEKGFYEFQGCDNMESPYERHMSSLMKMIIFPVFFLILALIWPCRSSGL